MEVDLKEINKIINWCKEKDNVYVKIECQRYSTLVWVFFTDLFKGQHVHSLEEAKKAYDNAIMEEEAIDSMLKES